MRTKLMETTRCGETLPCLRVLTGAKVLGSFSHETDDHRNRGTENERPDQLRRERRSPRPRHRGHRRKPPVVESRDVHPGRWQEDADHVALGKLQSAESNKEVIGSVQWLLLAYARLVQHDYPSYYEAGDTDVEETVRYFAMDMHKFATQRVDGDSVHVSMAYQDTLRATDAMWMKAQSKAWAESKKRAA